MKNTLPIIHVGIIGLAHTGHASAYASILSSLQNVELCGIADEDPGRLKEYTRQYGTQAYSCAQDLLESKTLDAVVICSETHRHREFVLQAATARKHILCEKPIATSLQDARVMIDACCQAGVLFQIPFVCRFYPMVQTARRMVQNDDLGRILGVIGGNRGVPPLPPIYPEWITNPDQAGGGAMLDHSVHVTDAMRFIFNKEVETVFAEICKVHEHELQVDEAGLISLTFENGMIATVDPSWSIPMNSPHHYDFYLRILGEKGTLDLDDTKQAHLIVTDRPGNKPVTSEPFGLDVDRSTISHFIHCVRIGEQLFPAASGEDGYKSLEIALAAYQSAELHQPVSLMQKGGSDEHHKSRSDNHTRENNHSRISAD